MPKDEFDFEDPLELNGVAFLTEADTSAEMAECFAEEFMRMGYNHKQVLALFRNPHYVGPNMVLLNKGEQFVRDIIAETFAKWGRPVAWGESQPVRSALSPPHEPVPNGVRPSSGAAALVRTMAVGPSKVFLTHNAAAPEDGRTPGRSLRFTGPRREHNSGSSHPGPLPQGEGGASTACAPIQRASTLPTAVEPLFPLPGGEGQGEGERGVLQSCDCGAHGCASSTFTVENVELDDTLTNPMGNLIPKLR